MLQVLGVGQIYENLVPTIKDLPAGPYYRFLYICKDKFLCFKEYFKGKKYLVWFKRYSRYNGMTIDMKNVKL